MINDIIKKYENDCVESYEWYEIVKDLQSIKLAIKELMEKYDYEARFDPHQQAIVIDDLQDLLGE